MIDSMINDRFMAKVKGVNVNSDLLVNQIAQYVKDSLTSMVFMDLRSFEDREALAETLEFFLGTLYENGDIVTFKVIFDKRNNKRTEMDIGKYKLDIKFQQKNCLNVTTLHYDITQFFDDEIEHIKF